MAGKRVSTQCGGITSGQKGTEWLVKDGSTTTVRSSKRKEEHPSDRLLGRDDC
jgi:hypothetical protein